MSAYIKCPKCEQSLPPQATDIIVFPKTGTTVKIEYTIRWNCGRCKIEITQEKDKQVELD